MINSNMSGPSKSLDKSKRFAGVKTNDFVNKTRANEANRSAIRPQGWANLGKINSRRIPPPANLPSLKSETGVNPITFDPTTATQNHGWTSNENPLSPNAQLNPTQQQIDSLPINSSTPPPSSVDNDKSRLPASWSTITAGATSTEPAPNLLALNDFPRLATNQDRKSQSETISTSQNPTFRPANLATWKEGGGGNAANRGQTLVNDSSAVLTHNPGANNHYQQPPPQNLRMYPQQMWNYNPYPPMPLMPPTPQRINQLNEYKTPTILRNKDIDDLSKLTDNTWANTTQEVNYEEKIRFSDDEDFLEHNSKTSTSSSSRLNNQLSSHTRLIQDDQHLKQMQDNTKSELINALTIAKQRRDEQERHLRNEQLMTNYDEQKPIPGYQTRPLLSSNEQENYTSRLNSNQSSFTMKSWSDQMDSFNYSSLHETSVAGHLDVNETGLLNHYSPSQSESSSQSISKMTKISTHLPINNNDYSNDQWENWNESNDNRQIQTLPNKQKINRVNKQSTIKTRPTDRQTTTTTTTTSTSSRTKSTKTQPVWRPVSPNRTNENPEPKCQQDSSTYKPHKQRYQTTTSSIIDTASIPPLMSVRSDLPPTDYYENENLYYDTNLPNHQRYNRGYTTLGSYGRYRRGGTVRQQQYANYHTNPTLGVSSAPITRQKKNGNSSKKSESNKNSNVDEIIKHTSSIDEESVIKPLQSLVLSPKIENEKSNGSTEQKTLPLQTENSSTKIEKKKSSTNTTTTISAKSQKRTNHDQSYQTPRHQNNYARSMQEYKSMPMSTTQNYYGTTRRTGQNTRHNHLHDLSTGYYYDQSQSHYNNRYNYSTDSYRQYSNAKTSKSTRSKHQPTVNKTANNNNNNNFRHHSTSDNDQKEGEEWETASESSTNMRNGHYETSGMNETKNNNNNNNNNHRGRTPPKKSFSNQRPNARQIFKYTNA